MEVREAVCRGDLNRFINFPREIYADDPNWVCPLTIDVKGFLDRRKHPFYRFGEATRLLALREGRVVGRILVSDDPHYNRRRETNLGCFGMFESVHDQGVADALLDAAGAWLRQRGRSSMMGPIDYSTNYPCGLLIDGFDTPPRIMMNHNRPYYTNLLEGWGLAKAKDLYAWWFDAANERLTKWVQRAKRLQERGNVTIRHFRRDDFEAEIQRCRQVYAQSRADHWGFVELTEDEFRHMAKRLLSIAIYEQVLLAENQQGRTVGFCVTLPDLNEAIRPLGGRLTTAGVPIGLFRLLARSKRIKTARLMILCLVEEYRRQGISERMILNTLDYGANTIGYTGAELSWTLEDNDLINRTIERVGARRYKTYRIYQKDI